MLYPASLPADLQYLAKRYEWNAEDKAEVRAAFTDCPEMVQFFTVLAAAHRAGYEQCAANGYIRLQAWCQEEGFGDPFAPGFDISVLRLQMEQTSRVRA
ncbi:hypothetical protein I5R65_07640 [Herbaspirillum sp. AP02]|uniref:hypothetical protein n=1 Tax=unclassified Herbaspirillum TaxID=2624150 RepID=UPI0015D9D407|nr:MULTISPECIES: hypothetical protein [unclassified Herbaspirillum]MBG7619332.1 hypothetical protein [Herbaspirillum sp. AP02]NZD66616.1 hypothetical protein [Herbaspirillum sp. AP21]